MAGDDDAFIREVRSLVERAQLGHAAEVLETVERRLAELGRGSTAAGPAGLHFARAVSLMYDDDAAALAATEDMVRAAVRENSQGWRSCALATRAGLRLAVGEQDPSRYDVESVLSDLAAAEAALDLCTETGYVPQAAHVAIALGYIPLRLYELAVPHQEAAYRIGLETAGPEDATPTMWLINLTLLHLQWTLELYRVGQDAEAEAHSALAHQHATAALARLGDDDDSVWRAPCELFEAAARSDGPDPGGSTEVIQRLLPVVSRLGEAHEHLLAVPFLAVALVRAGRREEALEVIGKAMAEVRVQDREAPTYLSLAHTQALLLTGEGSEAARAGARAALTYGDALAAAAWRQRQRTLAAAETMRAYAQLQAEHEQVRRVAETDALTGVANRRAFDRHVRELAAAEDATTLVAVLFIDLDGFKGVNDSLGHAAGDTMLQGIAQAIAANAREDDLIARIGGDEFAVLLPGADTEDAERAAQRIIDAVRDTPRLPSVSIGGAAGSAADVRDTITRADHAMYVAKRGGRDQHHVAPTVSA